MSAENSSIRFSTSPPLLLGPYQAAVSERSGGVSEGPFASLNVGRTIPDDPAKVVENETRILAALDLPDRVARLRLTHGARVVEVSAPGWYGPADALLTFDPELVLWFTVADCFPLTMTDGWTRVHGHCGWRGTAAGLPEAMLAALRAHASIRPSGSAGATDEIKAWIGPGIGPCCYPIGPETAASFPGSSLRPAGPTGKVHLDLAADIRRRLEEGGVRPGSIVQAGACTSCQTERFFSHRRDGTPSGRHAALCWRASKQDHLDPKRSR